MLGGSNNHMSTIPLVPIEMVNKILPNFGITSPSNLYERRVLKDGFKVQDLYELVEESPYVVNVDWRSGIDEELNCAATVLSRFGVELNVQFNESREDVILKVGKSTANVTFKNASGDRALMVSRALVSVLPQALELRMSKFNEGSDSWSYFILPTTHWTALEELANGFVQFYFKPLSGNIAPFKVLRKMKGVFKAINTFSFKYSWWLLVLWIVVVFVVVQI